MHLPQIRFTIRSVMVLVAITGVVLTGVQLRRRQSEYHLQASLHAAEEATLRARAAWASRMATKGYVSPREASKSLAQADQHARLKALYERAALRPWAGVKISTAETE